MKLSARNIQTLTARFVAVVFHPLFMPAYGLFIIFSTPTLFHYLPLQVKKILMLIIIVNNIALPVALMPFFRSRNIIKSWLMEERGERNVPMLVVSLLYTVTSFIMMRLSVPLLLKTYLYSVSLLSLTLLFINFRYKISIHAAGAGALTGLVLVLWIQFGQSLVWFMVPSLIISGLVLSCRLYSNSHNPAQVYTGYAAGFTVISAVMLLVS
ncbi:MAG TPA: hypothetical protein P5257_01255 [Bacteroidales bacterium]|nr:hypothetical protein [Bacteroidales bacterium]HRT88721.1 hypothetical protein [Bacteroidales bacterium]